MATRKEQYGLIGKRLGHSFSAIWFNEKFGINHIDAEYSLYELADISELSALISSLPALKGFNVTIPYKQEIIPFLAGMSEEARSIGAVNVVKVERGENGGAPLLFGHNSDAWGFRESLLPLLGEKRDLAVILGTGGASRAVEYVLARLGFRVIKVSRQISRGDDGASCVSAETSLITYDEFTPELAASADVIVNATPLGMHPDVGACPDIPYEALHVGQVCYDLVYNPSETLFLSKARGMGAMVKNGLEMLHLQAERAWDIWQTSTVN